MDENQPVVSEPVQQSQPEVVVVDEPGKLTSYWQRLMRFFGECKRVLKVIQKPSKEEFWTTAKVAAAGIGIIGLIGFVLSMIQQLVI